jgi:VWFA-related protein
MLTAPRYQPLAILTLALLVCSNSFSRQSILETRATPQIQKELVVLNVRVTDAQSHAVVDVPESNFKIFEDGVEQKIESFSKEQIPVTYGLVIDNSGSMRNQLSDVVKAGIRIIKSNKPEDEAFLIRFISSDKIQVVQETTSSTDLLIDGLEALYVEGGESAVVDAIYLATEKLAKQQGNNTIRRRALVLITDGEDLNSFYTREQLSRLLGSTDIQVYSIGFTDFYKSKNAQRATSLLTQLATDTGGRPFFPSSSTDLEHISDEIINDIRTQYIISYAPTGTDTNKSFHKIDVSITNDPQQQKRIAVTRLGYSTIKK